jgi:hypothetical protein
MASVQSISSAIGDFFHRIEHDVTLVTGKKAAEAAGGVVAGTANSSLALIATLGLISAVSTGLTQMEYHYQRKKLRHFYKEELAAKLGKDGHALTDKDLDALAGRMANVSVEKNHTISEALEKHKKQRNIGVGLSIIASLSTYGIVHGLIPAAAFAAFGATGGFVASAIVGLLIYNAVKAPIHWAADKLLGIDTDTVHDRIVEIQKDRQAGKTISREQVFSAFVAANPELSNYIAGSHGKPFDQLDVPVKIAIADNIGKIIQLDALTQSINSGEINVSELAFTVDGQTSGVAPKQLDGKSHGLLAGIKHTIGNLMGHVMGGHKAVHAQVIAETELPRGSFVEKLGMKKSNTLLSHVERVEQSRNREIMAERSVPLA